MAGRFSLLSQLSVLSQLRAYGFTQICVARGTVSVRGSRDRAAGELQLWQMGEHYRIYAGNTAGDEKLVCKVIDVNFSSSLPK